MIFLNMMNISLKDIKVRKGNYFLRYFLIKCVFN